MGEQDSHQGDGDIIMFKEKLFLDLLRDSDLFLDLARTEWHQLKDQTDIGNLPSQVTLHKQQGFSRASFVCAFAGLEALCNCIYKDFGCWTNKTFPREMIDKKYREKKQAGLHKKSVQMWPLFEKVIFLVSLCSQEVKNPTKVFEPYGDQMLLLLEYIDIRNSIVHGEITPRKMSFARNPDIRLTRKRVLESSDSFEENEWPLSKFPKFSGNINYECATRSNEFVKSLIAQLLSQLSGIVPQDYMTVTEGSHYRDGKLAATLKTVPFEG